MRRRIPQRMMEQPLAQRNRTLSLKPGKSRQALTITHLDAAGIDIGSASHFVAVPPDRDDEPVREFRSFTADLNALADWLAACGVDTVAMESTGVYWIALFELLESRRFTVLLVNARHVKNVSGRKSDVLDCQWLQQLMTYGLLRGAFRPAEQVCVLRAVSPTRHAAAQPGAPRAARASADEIAKSLQGNWRAEHLFALEQALDAFDFVGTQLAECDREIELQLQSLQVHDGDPAKGKKRGRARNAPKFDLRAQLFRMCGVDLTRIDGIDVTTALAVISEIGTDMSRFATVKHFTSWLCLCPGTKITGGKLMSGKTQRVVNRAAQALRLAAAALRSSKSALSAYFRRLCSRMDKPKAVTAAAHKLARLIYTIILTKGEEYTDQGQDYYEQRYRERVLRALSQRAAKLGMKMVPAEQPA